jgi:uncharacterized protein
MKLYPISSPTLPAVVVTLCLMNVTARLDCALAQPAGGIYQATVITTGTDTRFRNAGFAQALREVFVKASGEPRLANDLRVDKWISHADRLVAFFSYRDQMEGIHHHDDQGTYDRPFDLTVQFDWLSINSALAQLGEKPWLGERPIIVPLIVVRGHERPFDQQYMLTDEEPAAEGQRDSLSYCAQKYGLGLRLPSAADLTVWNVRPTEITKPNWSFGANKFVVIGTLDFRLRTFGWVGKWKATWGGVDYNWGVSGASFDRAFDNLLAGIARIASGHGQPD